MAPPRPPHRQVLHQTVLYWTILYCGVRDGINYAVRYLGCIAVNTSMKSLEFETRSAIAKECIGRVCGAVAGSGAGSGRRAGGKIGAMLGDRVSLGPGSGAGSQVSPTRA